MTSIPHWLALAVKKLVYGRRGEPYGVAGQTLRYVPGTRPVRLEYINSANDNVRYDALQVELFATHLAEGDVAIDIGAHGGQYAILMALKCGHRGSVVAFEPDPYARRLLQKNIQLNPTVRAPVIEALAVSDAAGSAVLYSMHGDSRSSLARSALGLPGRAAEQFEVKVVTLDEYCRDKGLPAPAWIKIDTEGAEIRILKGARELLAGKTEFVCELHPYAWPEFGNDFNELRQLASRSGRRIRYLDQPNEVLSEPHYGTVILERAS